MMYVVRKYEQRTTIKYKNSANKNVKNGCISYFYKSRIGANGKRHRIINKEQFFSQVYNFTQLEFYMTKLKDLIKLI